VIGAMVADYSPSKSRGLAFGIYSGGFDLGLMIGSVLGGMIGASLGIRSIFLLISILIILGTGIFFILKPAERNS
jgi:predicted MFS family arabinose efflux permease